MNLVDVGGNSQSVVLEFIKDTVIPTAVIISSPSAGELLNAATISDPFMGTGELGAMVTIIVSDGIKSVTQTTVVNSAGQWSTFMDILELDDGNVQIRANQTDSAGNISPNTSITVNKQSPYMGSKQWLYFENFGLLKKTKDKGDNWEGQFLVVNTG